MEREVKRRILNSPLWLLAPFLALFAVFWLAPLIGGIDLSLHSDTLFGTPKYVGFANYRAVLDDPKFYKALRNTLTYTLACIVVIVPLATLFAEALHRCWPRFKGPLSFILLLPGLTPPAVLALLFLLVFHGRNGFLNQWFVTPFGFAPIDWLKNPTWIMPALVIQATWRWLGMMTFFLLAGRESLPRPLFEVAALETDRRWPVFLSVTIPLLRHVILFVGIYLIVDAFAMFSGAYILLGGSGGTANAGLLMINYTYQQAFTFGKFSTAAAMSLSIAPLLLLALGLGLIGGRRLKL
ncbi:ABC transporter permease subunit [bacterium]|nr:ABC transporter permease subunit [bacterium]